ncbi:MAG: hypothetical protein CBB60_007155, partial [Armatimonadetes bacterium Cent15-Ar3]
IDAFVFCAGKIKYPGAVAAQINGALHCSMIESNKVPINISFDPFFWTDPQWDKRMRVPGMW